MVSLQHSGRLSWSVVSLESGNCGSAGKASLKIKPIPKELAGLGMACLEESLVKVIRAASLSAGKEYRSVGRLANLGSAKSMLI